MITTKDELMNTKIHVKNEEESRKVQERAFELGFRWAIFKNITEVSFLTKPYLYFYLDSYISYGEKQEFYEEHEFKEITMEDLFGEEAKGLTFMEAVEAMKQGKKVRRPNMVKGIYYCMPYYSNKAIQDSCIYAYDEYKTDRIYKLSLEQIEATDWEIIEEPKQTLWDKRQDIAYIEDQLPKKREYCEIKDIKEFIKNLKPLIDKYVDKVIHKEEFWDEISEISGKELI